jgi:hypothetical protein
MGSRSLSCAVLRDLWLADGKAKANTPREPLVHIEDPEIPVALTHRVQGKRKMWAVYGYGSLRESILRNETRAH